jgi:hypothetical protein
LKRFSEAGNRLCAFPIEYSETTSGDTVTVQKLNVAVGESRTATTAALIKSCDSLSEAGKIVCSGELKNNLYKCVHDSMFVPSAAGSGDWQCRMVYEVPAGESGTTPRLLLVTGKSKETLNELVGRAFSECATITEEFSEANRDACVSAMIERKMACSDLSLPPTAPARKLRLSRDSIPTFNR